MGDSKETCIREEREKKRGSYDEMGDLHYFEMSIL